MPLKTIDDVDTRAKIAYLDGQMKLCEMYANFWMTRINCGSAIRRDIRRLDDTCLTDNEKIDRALNTIETHIQRYQDCLDARDNLIRGEV